MECRATAVLITSIFGFLKCRNIFNSKNVLSIILFNFHGSLTESN